MRIPARLLFDCYGPGGAFLSRLAHKFFKFFGHFVDSHMDFQLNIIVFKDLRADLAAMALSRAPIMVYGYFHGILLLTCLQPLPGCAARQAKHSSKKKTNMQANVKAGVMPIMKQLQYLGNTAHLAAHMWYNSVKREGKMEKMRFASHPSPLTLHS